MIQSKKKWNNPLSAHQISIVVVLCLVKKPSNCLLQFLFTISNTVGNIQLLLTRSNIFLKSKLQEFAGSCCLQFCIEQIIISNSVSWQIILLQYLLILKSILVDTYSFCLVKAEEMLIGILHGKCGGNVENEGLSPFDNEKNIITHRNY